MPIHEVLRQPVLLQAHIDAEFVAGVQIVEIQAVGDVLSFNVIEIGFEFPTGKEFADGRRSRLPLKLLFAEQEVAHVLQGKSLLVCLRDGRKVIAVPPRQGEFLSVESNPFTKHLVFCYLFEQRAVLRIRAQAELEKILRLRILFVNAQVRDDVPAFIELIGAVLVFGVFTDDAAVDERGIRIVIARIGGITPCSFSNLRAPENKSDACCRLFSYKKTRILHITSV